ncbi:MAG: FHA domain-containing serine/threonine-protein kinase [Bacteroidota bacterium]
MHHTEDHTAVAERLVIRPGDALNLKSGNYTVDAELGEGGFGLVYRIKGNGQTLALKVLKLWEVMPREQKEIADRFIREYKAGQIESRHIVRSSHFGQLSGNPYILMDYCPNGSLRSRIAHYANPSRLAGVATKILQGLEDLHKAGIIHRDIKPENILFDANDQPKLTDFGISGFVNNRVTKPNWRGHVQQIWGTIVYMPPEQQDHTKAYKSVGPVTDIFATGVMLYEVLTNGQFPFGGFEDYMKDPAGFSDKVRAGIWVPIDKHLPGISSTWKDVLKKSMEPDPNDRFQSATEMAEALGDSTSEANFELPIPQSARWSLVVKNGDQPHKLYDLYRLSAERQKRILKIGWFDEDDPTLNQVGILELHTTYVSTFHATLEWSEERWYIRDGQWCDKLGKGKMAWHPSTNGTFVNYKKIDTHIGSILNPEDIITIGDTTLQVKVNSIN